MSKRKRIDEVTNNNNNSNNSSIDQQYNSTTLTLDDILPHVKTSHTQYNNISKSRILFVAIHCGAGYISTKKHNSIKQLINNTCKHVLSEDNLDSIESVQQCIKSLEQSGLVNAGIGSTLDMNKQQTIDSCITYIDSSMYIAESSGVGNVPYAGYSGIDIATYMLRDRLSDIQLSNNRIKPVLLCGNDVIDYAKHVLNRDYEPTSSSTKTYAISDKLKQKYIKYAEAVQQQSHHYDTTIHNNSDSNDTHNQTVTAEPEIDSDSDPIPQHSTVGCICVDSNGTMCCGSSSGGIWLKVPGRVGHSAIASTSAYGMNNSNNVHDSGNNTGLIGCITSGIGETLIQWNTAQQICSNNGRMTDIMLQHLNDCGFVTVQYNITNNQHYIDLYAQCNATNFVYGYGYYNNNNNDCNTVKHIESDITVKSYVMHNQSNQQYGVKIAV